MNAAKLRTTTAIIILSGTLVASVAFAKGKPPVSEEFGNNLSYATKFVPDTTSAPAPRLGCPTGVIPPTDWGDPNCTNFPAFPGQSFWCQKTAAEWQAECTTAATLNVIANWGANLVGDGRIRANKPVRVEMSLLEDSVAQPRFDVLKLTPELDDRLATYGTNAAIVVDTSYAVFDADSTLQIEKCGDEQCTTTTEVLPAQVMSAEINAVGKVVYGYNWGTAKNNPPAPGTYKITFCTNNTNKVLDNSPDDDGAVVGDKCTFVIVTVSRTGGGKPTK